MSSASTDAAPRPRDRDRRTKILLAATRLFREKGFHAVGIDEIGAAAGITGPGVYRHFAGKEGLLVAVLREATDELWRPVQDDLPLEEYVRRHVAFAVTHGDTIQLWHQEGRNLPAESRAAQREVMGHYIDRLVALLRAQRPDLSTLDARIRVRATIGLIHSSSHEDMEGTPQQKAPTLEQMAMAALLA